MNAPNLSAVLEKRGLDPTLHPLADSKRAWSAVRVAHGLHPNPAQLLTPPTANPKFAKTTEAALYGLSLAPAELSGYNVCPFSTAGCRHACLNLAGKGALKRIQKVRVARTVFLATHPDEFATILVRELDRAHAKHGDRLAIRLNTLSDLRWEIIAPWLFERYPNVQAFDYSKWARRKTPANYHITHSASERTTARMLARAAAHHAVAVVFDTVRGHPLPATYQGLPVIDGDTSDARWLNPVGVVIGLRAKGSLAIHDTSGFVRPAA